MKRIFVAAMMLASTTIIIAQGPPPPPSGGFGDGQRMSPPPGGFGGGPGMMQNDDSDATDPQAYINTEGESTFTDTTFISTTTDANAVKVSGGKVTLNGCTLNKAAGASSNADGSSFFGTNAALLVRSGAAAVMKGGTITTSAEGANGIVAYGGTVEVSDVKIACTDRLSRGIHVTGGGSLTARNLTITTKGPNSSVIALDRGGGTLNVYGGSYECAGRDCAVCYSTGEITVNGITGRSKLGEIGVIEGDNSITIIGSNMTSEADANSRGLMILQSGSGDAGEGLNGIINVKGGSLTMTGAQTPLIEIVTNVMGKVTLDSVALTIPSNILMKVDYNKRWRTYGATGLLYLEGEGTTYEGDVIADEYSSAQVNVGKGVEWRGACDEEGTAKGAVVTIDGGTWTLTANSHATVNILNGGQVNRNGYTLEK